VCRTLVSSLGIGTRVERTFAVDDDVVGLFGAASYDHNPLHFDEAYAATTIFGGRVAHGMLTAAFISAVLGNDLPGPGTVYLGQTLRFRAPVRVGDQVRVVVELAAMDEKGRATLTTSAFVGELLVVDGEARVLAPQVGRPTGPVS